MKNHLIPESIKISRFFSQQLIFSRKNEMKKEDNEYPKKNLSLYREKLKRKKDQERKKENRLSNKKFL